VANYLIWDFDGTLAYQVGGMWTATLFAVLREELPDHPATPDDLRPHLRTGFPWHRPEVTHTHLTSAEAWWDALDPLLARAYQQAGVEAETAARLARRIRSVYPNPARWRLFDDALPTLRELSGLGWTHYVLSNHVPELLGIADHLGLTPHLAGLFNSAQTGYEKPHPEAFAQVLRVLDEPRSVWMVGDSYEADVLGARAMGLSAILVHAEHPGAECRCAELSEVAAVLTRRARR
jgi:putative hydrolase of the HAD superfamily